MKHLFAAMLALGLSTTANAQWQINPQLGLTFQQITKAPDDITFAARAGFIGGADFRWGGRYVTYAFTLGVYIGDDDKDELPATP